jgi:hypothetical protein
LKNGKKVYPKNLLTNLHQYSNMDMMIGFELKSPVRIIASQKEKYLSYFGIEV